MATSLRTKRGSLPRLRALLSLPRFAHSESDSSLVAPEMMSNSALHPRKYDKSKWKTFDPRQFGYSESMIPSHSWSVLEILKRKGFDAYLVGGCVRDLVLNRIPKDFDVITTAKLIQIKKIFHRAIIVGRRFPICRVHIKGSVVEVSSFETKSRDTEDKKRGLLSCMSGVSARKDFLLWRDAMSRDFTINSLFFDPFRGKVYDYTNAMADLRSLKLQTLIPAKLSFTEDCARILRGLRIAARLHLALSKETEDAIHSLGPSITSLPKDRIMMEIDYMLSYGAAESSLHLLWRIGLAKLLLPLHSAYLDQQYSAPSSCGSQMLRRLFINLDKLVSCDHPSNSRVWVALLGFHLAIMNNPQDALVIWAFASVLYHGNWNKGVDSAREHTQYQVNFAPEISGSSNYTSKELAEKVSHLASLVKESVSSLCYLDSTMEPVSEDQPSSCSGWAYISKKVGGDVREIFKVLEVDVESYNISGCFYKIDYGALRKGYMRETRFILGRIILETMKDGIPQAQQEGIHVAEDETHDLEKEEMSVENESPLSDLVADALHKSGKEEGPQRNKLAEELNLLMQGPITKRRKVIEIQEFNEKVEKHPKVPKKSKPFQGKQRVMAGRRLKEKSLLKSHQSTDTKEGPVEDQKGVNISETRKSEKRLKIVEKKGSAPEATREEAMESSLTVEAAKNAKEPCKQKLVTEKKKGPALSSLFR